MPVEGECGWTWKPTHQARQIAVDAQLDVAQAEEDDRPSVSRPLTTCTGEGRLQLCGRNEDQGKWF